MTRIALKAEPDPNDLVAIVDTREQNPLDLAPLRSVRGTLATGDYSLRGLEHVVAIERKSLDDLIACVGVERERFDREMMRLVAYPVRCLVVEATAADIEAGGWRSKVTPAAALGSLLGWMAMGVPVLFAGDHDNAGRLVSRMLFIAARRRWRECRAFLASTVEAGDSGAFGSSRTTPRPSAVPTSRSFRAHDV